jgi:3-methyladenine DNA glycosylase AlkD
MTKIQKKLYSLQDKKYRDFQKVLIPTVSPKSIIGVRTPDIKKFAKELYKKDEAEKFLEELPHRYFDENQLHAFIISEIKDFDLGIRYIEKFLPYIDNWATCDQLGPKCFKSNKDKLFIYISKWLMSKKAYTVRFAIEMLMSYFMKDDFDKKYLDMVSKVHFKSKYKDINLALDSDKYYVEMMVAWYFATALAFQYKSAIPYIRQKKLIPWTHNKTIQKAIESFRVSNSHKEELKKFKIYVLTK